MVNENTYYIVKCEKKTLKITADHLRLKITTHNYTSETD